MMKCSKYIFRLVLESSSAKPFRNFSICKILHLNKQPIYNDDLQDPKDYGQFTYENVPKIKYNISKLQELFNCTIDDAKNIIHTYPSLSKTNLGNINEIITFCNEQDISKDMLCEYPWILGQKLDELKTKWAMLENLKPRIINDFIPFLELKVNDLRRLTTIMKFESPNIPEGNRLYYFEKKLKVKAVTIANYFAHRWFIYEVEFLFVKNILNFLLDSGVTPISILRDLWVFKYHPSKVRERITAARRVHSKNVKPWMVRCTEEVFKRFLDRAKETEALLANRTVEDFLSDKLHCDSVMAEYIVESNPSIRKIHVTKIQDTLDYLMEQGYTAFHIAEVPRILCHSLNTTKERIETIKKIGKLPSTLVVLCKSKKQFAKYITVIERIKKRRQKSNT